MRHECIPDGLDGQWRPTVIDFQVVQVKKGRLLKCPIPGVFLYDCGRPASQILMSQIARGKCLRLDFCHREIPTLIVSAI